MSIKPIRSDIPTETSSSQDTSRLVRLGFPALVVGLFAVSLVGILIVSFLSVLWGAERAKTRELDQIHTHNQTIGNLIYRGRVQKLEQILQAISRGSNLKETIVTHGNGSVQPSLETVFSNNHEGILDFLILLDEETGNLHKVATGSYTFDLLDASVQQGAMPVDQPFLLSLPGANSPTVLLVIGHHLVDDRTGRLIATIVGGTILTDNHSLVLEIRNQTQANAVGLYHAGTLIAHTSDYNLPSPDAVSEITLDVAQSIGDETNQSIEQLEERLVLTYPLTVGFGGVSELLIRSANPPGALNALRREFENDLLIYFGVVAAVSLLLALALYRFTRRALQGVAKYAQSVASGKDVAYIPTSILEFNELGKSVGDLHTALRDSEELSQQVLNKTPAVVLIKDLEGRYLFINRAAENLFDIRMDEVVGKTIFDVQTKEVAEAVSRNEKVALDRDEPVEFEEIIPTPRGARVFLSIKFPIRNTSGELVALCGISTDISERKRAESRLREAKEEADLANRAKTEFLANMSHELRTPLNAIIGFSDIMGSELFGKINPSRYQEYSVEIQKSGEHLLRLISDILDVSKIEIGESQLEEAYCSLSEMVQSSVVLLRERAFAGGITIENEVDADFPEIWADRRRITQVLINLLSNAVKFTNAGGKVIVRAEATPSAGCKISVIDTGIGMDDATLSHIFEPFVQGDDTMSKRFEGTGLGLTLVRKLVEQHGGKVELQSQKNVGTTATITLPGYRVMNGTTGLPQA